MSGATSSDAHLYLSVTAGSTCTFGIKCKSGKEGLGKYELNLEYVPPTPTGLMAAPVANTSTQIRLNWTATSGVTTYTVQRSTNQSTWTTLTSTEIDLYYQIDEKLNTKVFDNVFTNNTFQSMQITEQLVSESDFLEDVFLSFENRNFMPLGKNLYFFDGIL